MTSPAVPPPPPTLFHRARHTFTVGACALVVPAVLLAFSGLGFLRAHGAAGAASRAWPDGAALVGATGVVEVGDGRSLSFEFGTIGDGPLWVLLQNRRDGRNVLVSRSPGFEDYRAVTAGSAAERQLLTALRDLATRDARRQDARVQANLDRLCTLIAGRQLPCPAPADWYLY